MLTTKPKTKRCKAPGCRETFTPMRSFVTWCSPDCGAAIGKIRLEREKARRERIERAETRTKLEKFKKIPALIAAAQEAFNKFIRERDREKGCFVCGRAFDQNIPGRAIHAGHVRSRGAAGHLRFTEDNCLGECEGCNGPHGAKPHQIEAGAIARIGQDRVDALKNDNSPHKWTKDELRAIKATYAAKLKELRTA